MTRIRNVGGKILETTNGKDISFSQENIEFNSLKKISFKGEEKGTTFNKPEKPPQFKIEKSEYKLESKYAHDQLCSIADDIDECTFIEFVKRSFGENIEKDAYKKLYKGLSKREIEQPEIIVSNNLVGTRGGKAGYSNQRSKIYVWKNFVDEAINDNETRVELLAALVEEYGHHIDNLLRTSLSSKNNPDTDNIDEGAKFAYNLFYFNVFKESTLNYAKVETPTFSGDLIIDFSKVHKEITSYVDEKEQYDAEPYEVDIENFGAGFTRGSHGGIERAYLLDAKKLFTLEEVNKIYYGNWLRDYSQFIMESSIRYSRETINMIKKDPNLKYLDSFLWANPVKPSHEAMVRGLEILAVKEFMTTALEIDQKTKAKYIPNYEPIKTKFRAIYGELTKDILGIYRPEEHIDNPKGLKDCSILDICYNYEYEKGKTKQLFLYSGETAESLKYDQVTTDKTPLMLKNYICKNIGDRPSTDTYLSQQIQLAVQYGRTTEGLRSLGAAFHVIEDFYAHSNYVELALIRQAGRVDKKNVTTEINKFIEDLSSVYPWVQVQMDTKKPFTKIINPHPDYTTIPIVTGKFLLDDTKASVVPKIGDKIFSTKTTEYTQRKPGDRDFTDCFILNLLEDLKKGQTLDGTTDDPIMMGKSASTWLDLYNNYLAFVDGKAEIIAGMGKAGKLIGRMLHSMGEQLAMFTNTIANNYTSDFDDEAKKTQTEETNKDFGSDPTHTQVAKDVPEHLLNPLAATLAGEAIKYIAIQIIEVWKNPIVDPTGEKLANSIRNKFTMHPKFSTTNWTDSHVFNWAWANRKTVTELKNPLVKPHKH